MGGGRAPWSLGANAHACYIRRLLRYLCSIKNIYNFILIVEPFEFWISNLQNYLLQFILHVGVWIV